MWVVGKLHLLLFQSLSFHFMKYGFPLWKQLPFFYYIHRCRMTDLSFWACFMTEEQSNLAENIDQYNICNLQGNSTWSYTSHELQKRHLTFDWYHIWRKALCSFAWHLVNNLPALLLYLLAYFRISPMWNKCFLDLGKKENFNNSMWFPLNLSDYGFSNIFYIYY